MRYIIELDIVNIGRNGYNAIYCLEDSMATIAKKEGRDYQLMFADFVCFEYDYCRSVRDKKVIDSIISHNSSLVSQYNSMEKYHGLKFSDHKNEKMDAVYSAL